MHIVVNGQIRHIACYRILLQRLAQALEDGVIQSATLVHWTSEQSVARELASVHPGRFELKILDEPKPIAPGHFFHQSLSLHEGLAERRADDIVLRLRPDIFGAPGFIEAIAGVLKSSTKPLWTTQADLTCPFFANDIVFGGRVNALRAQTNFSMEPFLTPIKREEAKPYAIHNHEPEIQRWLHPWRDDDWVTRGYWRTFPNFGLSTLRRARLLRRFHEWDFFETVRLAWLRRLVDQVALGGLEQSPLFGLVRATSPTDAQAKLWLFNSIAERELVDEPATLKAEGTHLIWTTSDRKSADFLAFCEARAPQPRPLTPKQIHDELASIWAEVLTGPSEPRANAPMKAATINF